MRIINQRRDVSLNFDDIDIFINGTQVCSKKDGIVSILGIYANEKRAKEVFIEIHKVCELTYYMPLE